MRTPLLVLLLLSGCIAAGHDQAAVQQSADAALAGATVERVEAAVVKIEASVTGLAATAQRIDAAAVKVEANVKVGGGGDSVTAWLYACIAGAALLYPLVIRPTRQYLERRRSQVGSRKLSKRHPPIRSPPVARESSP